MYHTKQEQNNCKESSNKNSAVEQRPYDTQYHLTIEFLILRTISQILPHQREAYMTTADFKQSFVSNMIIHSGSCMTYNHCKGQIPLRYPASKPVSNLLASSTA